MKKRLFQRSTIIVFCLLLLSGSAFGWLLYRAARQERLNQALLTALHDNRPEEVLLLLHQGADANTCEVAEPPHTWREILVRWLRPPAASLRPDTVLMLAARQGDISSVQWLLDAGARVNVANSSDETALTAAFTGDHLGVMQVLLTRGANPNVKTCGVDGSPTPLLNQMWYGFNRPADVPMCRTVMRLMLDKGVDVNTAAADGDTALISALQVREPEIAQWLIARGADLNKGNSVGQTPLHASTYDAGGLSVFNTLLQHGVDVTPVHNGGWNVLCWAAEENNISVAQAVIQRGLSVNSRDRHGRTPLMYAAANAKLYVLNLLLAQGAEVDMRDDMGWTALIFAAQGDNLSVVDTLLHHGVNRQLRDPEKHWTAEQRAIHVGQEQVANLLQNGHSAGKQDMAMKNRARKGWKHIASHILKRIPVDAHRWIETVRCPEIQQEGTNDAWGAVIVDDNGRRGKPFGGETFFSEPEVQVFHDTDERSYAFLEGHHRAEANCIVAIRGRKLVRKAECYARYGISCQPLPGGGALITGFGRPSEMEGLPAVHQNDNVAEVSRFRQGNLTYLGLIFLPQQN